MVETIKVRARKDDVDRFLKELHSLISEGRTCGNLRQKDEFAEKFRYLVDYWISGGRIDRKNIDSEHQRFELQLQLNTKMHEEIDKLKNQVLRLSEDNDRLLTEKEKWRRSYLGLE